MVNTIKNHRVLKKYVVSKIEDNGLMIEVDTSLTEEEYASVKVDDYYNDLHMVNSPPSVDYVVSVDCACGHYRLYILELKKTRDKNFTTKEIEQKFDTTINDFLGNRFQDIYCNDKYQYDNIYLYIVSTAFMHMCKSENISKYREIDKILNKKGTVKMDCYLSQKMYKFRGKVLRIEKEIPPNPIISRKA